MKAEKKGGLTGEEVRKVEIRKARVSGMEEASKRGVHEVRTRYPQEGGGRPTANHGGEG